MTSSRRACGFGSGPPSWQVENSAHSKPPPTSARPYSAANRSPTSSSRRQRRRPPDVTSAGGSPREPAADGADVDVDQGGAAWPASEQRAVAAVAGRRVRATWRRRHCWAVELGATTTTSERVSVWPASRPPQPRSGHPLLHGPGPVWKSHTPPAPPSRPPLVSTRATRPGQGPQPNLGSPRFDEVQAFDHVGELGELGRGWSRGRERPRWSPGRRRGRGPTAGRSSRGTPRPSCAADPDRPEGLSVPHSSMSNPEGTWNRTS